MKKKATAIVIAASMLAIAGCSAAASPSESANVAADVAAAEAAIAAYVDAPSEFPITEPLAERPDGAHIAILDCGTPICRLIGDLAETPAELLGMSVTRIEAGLTADGVAAAFDTVIEGDFDGVYIPGIAPSLWESELPELDEAGIVVVASGAVGLDPAKIAASVSGEAANTLSGEVMADWVVAEDGDATNVVLYTTPELALTEAIADGFTSELDSLCPECPVRTVEIPAAQFGAGGAQIVVDDLIANPETTTAVFSIGEQAIGLPAALRAADLEMKTLLYSPDPSVLEGIKSGDFTAGVGLDIGVFIWTAIDSLARAIGGQDIGFDQTTGDELVRQVLTAENLPEDVSNGWSGYPDFAERFQELWADAS